MENLVYDKKYHFLNSLSVWLDLDSLVYILAVLLLAWGITNLICKCRKQRGIKLFRFAKKYMILCALPIFILFAVQLAMSGIWTSGNILIAFLPLLYGAVIQIIFIIINPKK